MQITYQTSYDEIVRLLLLARKDLEIAQELLKRQNYGLASDWVSEAEKKLPEDTDEGGVVWLVSENFSSERQRGEPRSG